MTTTATTAGARERLRIAIQKGGRLSGPARELLRACGLAWHDGDALFCPGDGFGVDLLLVRDDDIPGLLADGSCDLGIVGRNVLREQACGRREETRELRPLGFGGCRLSLAVPEATGWTGPSQLRGRRIATSYPALAAAWLREEGVDADIVVLKGSVEIAPRLGQADAVIDLVSTGSTLAANRLREVAVLLESEAVLAASTTALTGARATVAGQLLRRLDGVLRQRDSRLLLCRAPRVAVPALLALLPDAEAPVLTRIDGSDAMSLQAICHGAMDWPRLEALERAGASAVMVLPIERMLA
ncbi:MAG TPA: ATP phosphoribosyltransferase [Xanthomonadaceae bacterium]|nr:ATP phosphoribosyltransferase [Xanthomonadaceae bacterium]